MTRGHLRLHANFHHLDGRDLFLDRRAASDAADKSLKLHRHQEQALGLALDAKSFVVTTGTGSGKSLCFFIPIIDAVIKAKEREKAPAHAPSSCTR